MLAWLVAACALVAPSVAPAADAAKSPADAVALPAPLTQDAVRELVSRLSDEDVRKLLIQQLDKSAAPARSADDSDAGVLERVGSGVADARKEVIHFGDGARALPDAVRQAGSALVEQSGPTGVLGLAAFFAGMLGVGAIAEVLWRRASRRWRAGLRAKRASGFFGEILRFVLRVIGEVAHVVIFGVGALIVFFAAWNGGPATRIALLGLLAAFAVTRLVWALAAFLLAPGRPADKLLPLDDATGRVLVRGVTVIALSTTLLFVATQVLQATGGSPSALRATWFIVSTLVLAVAIWIVWRIRLPIAALIRQAGGGGAVSGWAADLWPLAAILYLLTIYVARLWDSFNGVAGRGEGIASLAILVAVPIVDYALCRTLARSLAPEGGEAPGGWRKVAVDYEPVLRRLIHIGVIVGGFALLAKAWDL
ncbi:MAG TPA: hypothetical protein VFX05_08460, partial [Casimicrobiaceae bacterium]|nr:hypothetical protein [Casimicrobiaceae bacterium]